MKEFGKIIKSFFILKYYDELALRQSIEKMLSHKYHSYMELYVPIWDAHKSTV